MCFEGFLLAFESRDLSQADKSVFFPKLEFLIPLRRLKAAILKLPLPLPLLQTAIMEICAVLKAQTDAPAASSKNCHFL